MRRWSIFAASLLVLALLVGVGQAIAGQSHRTAPTVTSMQSFVAAAQKRVTSAERQAAAAKLAALRAKGGSNSLRAGVGRLLAGQNPFSRTPAAVVPTLTPGAVPDYYGIANYANSQLPDTSTPAPAKFTVRFTGPDRYSVALAAAKNAFPGWNGVKDVVVASGDDAAIADVLSSAGLAGAYGGGTGAPFLLVPEDALNTTMRNALNSLPNGVHVHIVGGAGSVSANTASQMLALSHVATVDRIGGANRYEVAANVAAKMKSLLGASFPSSALVVNGASASAFYDALAASAISAKAHIPLLLVNGSSVPASTSNALSSLGLTTRYIIGSVSSSVQSFLGVPSSNVIRGNNRFATAVAIATKANNMGWLTLTNVGIANVLSDASAGGAYMCRKGGPLLYTNAGSVPAETSSFLASYKTAILGEYVFGGTASVGSATQSTALSLISGGIVTTGGIRKFVDALPGLGAAGANALGQYIPVANPDTAAYPGSDYYVIGCTQYQEKLGSDIPTSTLRGYYQINSGTSGPTDHTVRYLGPTIVAQKDRPVRVKFINQLPTGMAGNLQLPVDTTIMGAGMGPDGGMYSQNRATLHLHGGATPWISDGTPHQWTAPAGEVTTYTEGVSVHNVPDMDGGVEPTGTLTFYYTNQQSARLMFYHDHTYGLTRLNVYMGEAAPFVLQDSAEQALVNGGNINANGTTVTVTPATIPTEQVPLVIQDKTFVPTDDQLAKEDPTWDKSIWGNANGSPGGLWLPHVYMPNQIAGNDALGNELGGVNPYGRWDYGPWFYPPFVLGNGSVAGTPTPNPLWGQPGQPKLNPGTPTPTIIPEAFMDTPIVNGAAYPYLKVQRKAYRFRILNACDDRMLNLQIYFAKSNGQMWASGTATKTLNNGNAGEVPMVEACAGDNLPATWPTDGRAGGVPDPKAVGPSMIQIGNEGGFLPSATVLPNTPIGYEYFRRTITVLNVTNKTLMLGPAERADVIVDFSQVPAGSKLIMYNDAPAPVPAFDTRLDYYTGDPDQQSSGGAPSTQLGYGPNTRTIMQFQVATTGAAAPKFNLAKLQTGIQAAYAATQPKPIVPESAYSSAFATSYPDNYLHGVDTTLTFTPADQSSPATFSQTEKAIVEGFDTIGRMNANLGGTLQNFGPQAQGVATPYDYADAPTDVATNTIPGTQIGALDDGTQIWRIDHQGVDTHAIHFHLMNVQLINRIAIDGQLFLPDQNELGWKETIRMNPGQDVIIAIRPQAPTLPWKLPDSWRLLDPALPAGATWTDTNGTLVTNVMTNFGWEYVWHCHLLGHEENDMMRPFVFEVAPSAPLTPTATPAAGPQITLNWVNTATFPAATDYVVERANDAGFTTGVIDTMLPGTPTSWVDTSTAAATTYYYRVRAESAAGYSQWSGTASATTP